MRRGDWPASAKQLKDSQQKQQQQKERLSSVDTLGTVTDAPISCFLFFRVRAPRAQALVHTHTPTTYLSHIYHLRRNFTSLQQFSTHFRLVHQRHSLNTLTLSTLTHIVTEMDQPFIRTHQSLTRAGRGRGVGGGGRGGERGPLVECAPDL